MSEGGQQKGEVVKILKFIKEKQCVCLDTLAFNNFSGMAELQLKGLINIGIVDDNSYASVSDKGQRYLDSESE